jgi:nicotinamide-nucleotide amidase
LKAKLAFVSQETLDSFGAVSEEAVIEMARGGQSVLNVDYCISISGIAGPEGGTSDKPVGTVWMALAYEGRVDVKKLNLGGDRERNIQMTIFAGMNMLRLVLLLKNK